MSLLRSIATPAAAARALRLATRRWPTMRGTGLLSRGVDAVRSLVADQAGPHVWAEVPPTAEVPPLVLDLKHPHQRKLFYFTRAYAPLYLDERSKALMRAHLRRGGVLLDVGANVGFWSLAASPLVGTEGRVHAFEPDPSVFAALSRGVERAGLGNVTCHPIALSDAFEPRATLHVVRDGTASSLVGEPREGEPRYAGAVEVEVDSLDRLVSAGTIELPRIDLVKIDVEGVEARVVAGMLETLERCGRPPLYVEVRGPEGSRRAPDTYDAVLARLSPLGYEPRWVAPDGSTRAVRAGEVRGREDVLFIAKTPGGAR